MSDQSTSNRGLGRFFEAFYYLWAIAGLPIGIGLGGYVLYRMYPNWIVLSFAIVAFVVSVYVGYRLAEFIRRKSRHRGGMAGGMATHATPELDDAPPDDEDENSTSR